MEELYEAENSPRAAALIARILTECGVSQNFRVQATNVETVAAVVDGEERFLFYNPDWFAELPDSAQSVAVALFAHEIAHLVKGHKLDGSFRAREEAEADEFMGFALAKLGVPAAEAVGFAQSPAFAYPAIRRADREKAIATGWGRADNLLKSKDKLNFLEDPGVNAALPIPRFHFPPPECSAREVLDKKLFANNSTLADVDEQLKAALYGKGYDQRAYYSVPNGFAVVTQMEQFDKTSGMSKAASVRWVDYPVQEDFDGFWAYCKSLVMPASGFFRVMAFVVTDQPFTSNGKPVTQDVAAGWLTNGADALPKSMGDWAWKEGYKVTLLTYEFEAPASTKVPEKLCPCVKTGKQHLDNSGLAALLKPIVAAAPKAKAEKSRTAEKKPAAKTSKTKAAAKKTSGKN